VTQPHAGGAFWTRRRFLLAAAVVAVGAGATVEAVNLAEGGGGGHELFRPKRLMPGQVLDLRNWKIGLPTTGEVKQPRLEGFSGPAFEVVPAVTFTARAGDKAQDGSKYARSELREMNPDGSNASWSTTSGTHVMELRQRVTHLPVVKPQVICGQIHSTTDYLILVELEASKLYVRYRDDIAGVLDGDYRLGTYFRLRLVAADGFADVYYNGVHKVRHKLDADGCYFKAGCYVQSSTATGDAPTAFAAVDIAELSVSHRR
jgi:poly(beta-D-mannuronate) lyase